MLDYQQLHFIDKPYNNPLIFEFKVTQDYR